MREINQINQNASSSSPFRTLINYVEGKRRGKNIVYKKVEKEEVCTLCAFLKASHELAGKKIKKKENFKTNF